MFLFDIKYMSCQTFQKNNMISYKHGIKITVIRLRRDTTKSLGKELK